MDGEGGRWLKIHKIAILIFKLQMILKCNWLHPTNCQYLQPSNFIVELSEGGCSAVQE